MIYKEQLCTASYEEMNMSHQCEVEFIIIYLFFLDYDGRKKRKKKNINKRSLL